MLYFVSSFTVMPPILLYNNANVVHPASRQLKTQRRRALQRKVRAQINRVITVIIETGLATSMYSEASASIVVLSSP
jgi:hypothetical protein